MLKVLSLFSGIGAFEKALENIDEPFELVNYCEIDKYAAKAFALIHGIDESLNLGDITAIDTAKVPTDLDIITYGFPCQDISNAGKQKGFTDENGKRTRSGLFFEALRIIESAKPKFAIAENVKALTGKKFKNEFKIVLDSLDAAGYANYWAVLNAKDYGIPQNRERVFIISIRKDIDRGFEFPKPYPLKLRLKDMLEKRVDERYYLSDSQVNGFIASTTKAAQAGNGFKFEPTEGDRIAKSVLTRAGTRQCDNFIKIIQVGNCKPTKTRDNPNQGRIYDPVGLAPTLNCKGGGNLEPFIVASRGRNPDNPSERTAGIPTVQRLEPRDDGCTNTLTRVQKDNYLIVKEATKKGYAEVGDGDFVNLQFPNSKTRRGRVGKEISQTLLCNDANGVVERLRIRKLTPKECFRLMGFDDRDVDILIENKISNTQLYKMAGNSIVVDVLEEIYVELLNKYY